MPAVSVILTVYNEADNIERVLDGLRQQTLPPTEIVIVDGGSTDGTFALLEKVAQTEPLLQPFCLPKANISQGRNFAIRVAQCDLIAVTDAGTHLPADWLANLVKPFADTQTEAVAGFFQADIDPASVFHIAMSATVLPLVDEINPSKFLPSSRSVAFTKRAWQSVGGYPEWLDYCEDLIFDLALQKKGYKFEWQPSALAFFAPRRNLRSFCLQYYRYARGDGKADLFFKRHALRYLTYGLFAPLGIFLTLRTGWFGLILGLASLAYLRQPYRRLLFHCQEFSDLSPAKKLATILWIPIVRATGDFAKMLGYPVGVAWRRQHRPTKNLSTSPNIT